MDVGELTRKFMEADMQLTEGALEVLRGRPDAEILADRVLETLVKLRNRPLLITAEIVGKVLEGEVGEDLATSFPIPEPKPEFEEKLPELSHVKFKPLAAEHDSNVEVLKEITGRSYCKGELSDFVKLFNNRFEKLHRFLSKRTELSGALSLSSLRDVSDRELVAVIGIVVDKRRSAAGNIWIELEDTTGRALACVFESNRKLLEKADEVVVDEVIGVIGSKRSGGRYPRIFVRDILWPDLPVKRERRLADYPLSAVLLSDLHVGSEQFMEGMFRKFIHWLRGGGETRREIDVAGRVKYLVIAGDIVDGVGIYPEQIDELLINDIFKQYEEAGKLLAEIPDYITIVVAPGNHDAVRPSEPQPAISKDVAGSLYDLNSKVVGNPALISLEGTQFLVYHGRSFDDLIGAVPGLTRQKPTELMIKLLQKRHMAPIYGGRVAISPEEQDALVIEDVPDVFHCGHVHIYDYVKHRDVWVVNSGTFQAKTKYMQKLGVEPTPGHVPILDLQTMQLEERNFAGF
jgi:DNA polymerase II small subunit